jgi:hypothetical protein
MYFVRLQVSHLNEALKIIRELRDDPSLMKLVDRCDAQTRASFTKLEQFMPGGAQHDQFAKVAGRIRQNLGFHYDESGKLIAKALKDRVAKYGASPSSITRGSTAHLWHFELADEILDRIVVREIWKISEPGDLRTEADKMAMWIHDILLAFVDFCGEFIRGAGSAVRSDQPVKNLPAGQRQVLPISLANSAPGPRRGVLCWSPRRGAHGRLLGLLAGVGVAAWFMPPS